jgi:hypothetical protein
MEFCKKTASYRHSQTVCSQINWKTRRGTVKKVYLPKDFAEPSVQDTLYAL